MSTAPSVIAAQCDGKIVAPFAFEGCCNTEVMETYVEKVLIPELKKGQIVVLDNASFHKSKRITELIEAAECKALFLPPYSPDLNPIENFWAVMKSKIKKYLTIFTNLNDTIDYVFQYQTLT